MPKDYWRFSYEAFSIIYDGFYFIEEFAMKSLTRSKVPDLVPFSGDIFEVMHEKAEGETNTGRYIRRFHRKLCGGKLFEVSRLLPEQTFYGVAKRHA